MTSRFQKFLRKHRPACVAYESVRWGYHKLVGWWEATTPVWYSFNRRPLSAKQEFLPLNAQWYHIRRPLYMHEHVYYNLDNALAVNKNIKGFAFVFFMGIGDYLYTTPVLDTLKKKYPSIPFYGYVGENFDRNNSPLVGKLLEENPAFEKVSYFKGTRHPLIWKNYDYSAVLADVPRDFLVIPVYYEYGTHISHRVNSLFETFGLPVPNKLPVPQMYFPKQIASVVNGYLKQIQQRANGKKGIVFLQLDSRSSNYAYPHVNALAKELIAQGYFVMSVSQGGPTEDVANYLEIDIKQLSINQTWQLLYILKQQFSLYVISVASVFWAASAGLGLPNLGLQHWIDKKIHNVWYPNIEVVTPYIYKYLPQEKQIYAPAQSYTPHNKKIVDYKPQWVARWFIEKFGGKR